MPHSPRTERSGASDETPAGRQRSDSPLVYLAAPFSHPDPEVSWHRLHTVSGYAAHLLDRGILAISPLSHGAQLDSPGIPDSVWYELGLRILEGCDQLWLLALNGWDDSGGVRLELERARQLDIPVYVVSPDTHEVLPWEKTRP